MIKTNNAIYFRARKIQRRRNLPNRIIVNVTKYCLHSMKNRKKTSLPPFMHRQNFSQRHTLSHAFQGADLVARRIAQIRQIHRHWRSSATHTRCVLDRGSTVRDPGGVPRVRLFG
jgi:hypothetical protein